MWLTKTTSNPSFLTFKLIHDHIKYKQHARFGTFNLSNLPYSQFTSLFTIAPITISMNSR